MNKILIISIFILIATFFNACTTKKTRVYKPKKQTTLTKHKPQNKTTKHKNFNYKSQAIYKQYKKWKGTKYKYGGTSLNGVDCSSFIQQVYFDAFGLKVPRTTEEQAKMGYKINKKQLKAGDMILFKSWISGRHVGIMVENSKFIHASTKRGVTISSIHNLYYKSNYWQSRRVLP